MITILKMTSHNIYVILEVWWKGTTVTHTPEILALWFELLHNMVWNFVATDLFSSFIKPLNFKLEVSIFTSHKAAFNYSGYTLLQA